LASTSVHSAADNTPRRHVLQSDFLPVVTPLIAGEWERALRNASLLDTYQDVVEGIRNRFDLGITSYIVDTYTPPNHSSSNASPDFIDKYILKERSESRYSGPYSRSRLEHLIGPFRSSPLGLVPKASDPQYRLVQDLSYLRNDPLISSVNSDINADDFPCEWGTFAEVFLLVIDTPPRTEAATLDVDAAF